MIRFSISGTPRPQPRPRFVNGGVVSTAKKVTKLWRDRLVKEFKRGAPDTPLNEPIAVYCLAMFPTRKSERWGKPHTARPDRDNLEKAALDCLVKAGVIKDDALVHDGSFRKVWAQAGGLDVQVCRVGEKPEE